MIGGGEATGGGVVGGGVFEVVAKLIDRLIEPALQQVLVPGMRQEPAPSAPLAPRLGEPLGNEVAMDGGEKEEGPDAFVEVSRPSPELIELATGLHQVGERRAVAQLFERAFANCGVRRGDGFDQGEMHDERGGPEGVGGRSGIPGRAQAGWSA